MVTTRMLRSVAVAFTLALTAPQLLHSQERGAVALGESVAGLDVTARVLVIGAHPDDEDTQLIAYLARGRQVETAYLSLTRGDGGQNLIGNELGPLLGMIRTQELLAARRIDGGHQFFTRAYDFGFSKSAEETFTHWQRDSILKDVVTVVRAFRPQIIVAVFSGTPRDGHGHHQVSGILAREAFDAAADTVRWPSSQTLGLGAWTPTKFYRAARFNAGAATVGFNVGELSPLRGRTYAEIASESRSQHLSQGFGILERRGTSMDYLTLEATHFGVPVGRESSIFQGVQTDWSRFATVALPVPARAALDSLPAAIAAVRSVERLIAPAPMVAPLARVVRLLSTVRENVRCGRYALTALAIGACDEATGDLVVSLEEAQRRARTAILSAAGVLVEATAPRELLAVGDTMPVTVSVYNQGSAEVTFDSARVSTLTNGARAAGRGVIAPDSAAQATLPLSAQVASVPWWLAIGLRGDMFVPPGQGATAGENIAVGEDRLHDSHAQAILHIDGVRVVADASPVIQRFADPARGELRRPVAAVPAISVLFDDEVEYARAGVPLDRVYAVHLKSATAAARGVTVTLTLPAGLRADSAVRHAALPPFGSATLAFRVRGTLPAGRFNVSASATSNGETFVSGYIPIEYAHIPPLRYYRAATVQVEAVDAKLPANTRVAYIQGVGDNVMPMLSQLGLAVTPIAPEALGAYDLSGFGAVVVGPRAFAASDVLVREAKKLQDYARAGGTVVMQYGQNEMERPGILPYAITLARPAQRVTDENAPVTILDPRSPLLTTPNRITSADFAGWVQERATYMPSTFDPHWKTVLRMNDPGEPPNDAAILVAPVGKGVVEYVTLALFRQLPAGVPGGARLFLNLLSGAKGSGGAGVVP
jgi:LmbE family N-acetylglucosaminyl deacetylase